VTDRLPLPVPTLVLAGLLCLAALVPVAADARAATTDRGGTDRVHRVERHPVRQWVYQLQGYGRTRLAAVAEADAQLAVVDLARDAHTDYFTAAEVQAVRETGKVVLAYFEVGSIEDFRPEYPTIRDDHPDLILHEWGEWPGEFFVKYWTDRWWTRVVRPRLDRALETGYDGVYLDTLLAYEEIPLQLAGGRSRWELGRLMAQLVGRIDRHAAERRPGFLVVPQNSPELRRHDGFLDSVDGIAMEELFYRAHDRPCTREWCAENLAHTRAIQDAGRFVLAVDYAKDALNVRATCAAYERESFAGYVTVRALDRVRPACPTTTTSVIPEEGEPS
jgi:cysteinyl-tRNA synthetase, unknown class